MSQLLQEKRAIAAVPDVPGTEHVYRTRDFGVAVWLLMNGLTLRAARRVGRRDFRFTFNDEKGTANETALKWPGSAAQRFDSTARDLKKVLESDDQC